ncbi:hypothetical protein [Brucella anthropi]|uniref:hypothetical protein n=1 Tax=Brucella anthropi TaxID=529 RepID=UPI00384B797F
MMRKSIQASFRWLFLPILLVMLQGFVINWRAARADVFPGATTRYNFVATNQRIVDILQLFGKNLHIPMVIEASVTMTAESRIVSDTTAHAFLDKLAREFGIIWYYDGNALNISTSEDNKVELFSLDRDDGAQVIRVLDRIGIYQSKFHHRVDLQNKVLLVAGPSSYIAVIKKAVAVVEKAGRTSTTVLRGNNLSGHAASVPPAPSILEKIE